AIEESILNRMPWERTAPAHSSDPVLLLTREWLVTNALGGYASASVSGACTRRYHGLLIAALPKTLGRIVMLSHFAEEIALPDETVIDFGGEELSEEHLNLHAAEFLRSEEHTSELQSRGHLVCRLLLEKKNVLPGRLPLGHRRRPSPRRCRDRVDVASVDVGRPLRRRRLDDRLLQRHAD